MDVPGGTAMTSIAAGFARRLCTCALCIWALVVCASAEVGAQTKGRLAYDTATDAGFLTLWGTNGNRLARLWVGEDDSKGRLLIYDDGDDKVLIDSDINSQGRIILYNSDDEIAARLTVDDSADTGLLQLYDDSETVRVDLGVDPFGQGRLILDGSDNLDRGRFGVHDDTDSAFLTLRGARQTRIGEIGRYSSDRPNYGRLQLYADGSSRVDLYADPTTDAGKIALQDSGGVTKITINGDAGALTASNSSGEVRLNLGVDDSDQGFLILDGSDGIDRGRLGINNDTDSAFLRLRGQSQASIGEVGRYSAGEANHGRVRLYADGSTKVDLHADPTTDGGRILLRDSSGAVSIALDGQTGDVTAAGMKSFVVAHPTDSSKEIFYVALEGPEAGIFTRGTASLDQGAAIIALPEHFAALADPATITVQLTPGSAETSGLAVVGKSAREIQVRELQGGTGDFSFDYLVHASRSDVPPLQVVRARASRELSEDAAGDAPPEEQDSAVRHRGEEGDSQSEGGAEQ
jgi:hypothetical protein